MNKKLIGILVIILFFGATVCPSIADYEKVVVNKEIYDYNNPIKYALEGGVLSNNSWLEQDKLIASDGADEDRFSWCVSIDGDYALIGACQDDNNRGSAYVFKRSGTTWTEVQKLMASDRKVDDHFGWSVSINGEYALIGASQDDNGQGSFAGAAYVFKRSGTNWTQQAKLMASDGDDYEYFAQAVSIDGNYAYIGAPHHDDKQRGAVYVFKRSGTTWTEVQKLMASDLPKWEHFGRSVSIDGDYLIITAHDGDYTKGSAYVFKRNGTTWVEEQKLQASDRMYIGWVVSIDGDYILIGSPYENKKKGAAYVFKRDGNTWIEQQKLMASDGEENAWFGRSVSIDGEYAIIGAPIDDSWTGAVYVFKRDGNTWTETQKLRASDTIKGDDFGWSVSIDGDNVLIGALYGEYDRGAAYVFIKGNSPPNAPNITGPSQGKPGVDYYYKFVSTDLDGDYVSYYIKWGDGEEINWTAFQPSGNPGYYESHAWDTKGIYIILAKAKEKSGAETNWSSFSVTIPRNKATSYSFFLQFLERFPLLKQLFSIYR